MTAPSSQHPLSQTSLPGVEVVEGFRKSLDEGEICMMADAAVTMEEEFLLDIISDLDPTASVYCEPTKPERKSARRIAQRQTRLDRMPEDEDDFRPDFAMRDGLCASPESSMSDAGSSCSSSTLSGEISSGWTMFPVVTPQQMFALGQMVKEQRSCSSSMSSLSSTPGG